MKKEKGIEIETLHDCGGEFIAVEYGKMDKYHYDGISEYLCMKCKKRFGRWCDAELMKHEVEPPFHQGGIHPRVYEIEQGSVEVPIAKKGDRYGTEEG